MTSISTAGSAGSYDGDHTKLVSVIMPTYSSAKWVGETIDNLSLQTYPHVELIIVDDGSPDDTVSVIRQKLSSHFKYHWRIVELGSNAGPSAARNAGLRAARGSWIQFMDSDDFIARTKLESQMAYCISAPAELAAVYSPWRRCYVDNGKFSTSGPLVEPNMEGMAPIMRLVGRGGVLLPSGLARRDILNQIGGFDEALRFWEFENLNVRLSNAGTLRVIPANEPYYFWRLHRGKIYIGGDEARYRSRDVALTWIQQLLDASEHKLLTELPLSAADYEAVLADCTKWARLLYSQDIAAFRKFIGLAKQLVPDIAPAYPKYASAASRLFGYEKAEAIASFGRTPRRILRKTLQSLNLREKNSVFDWN
jgi:glycosyltransferase involved in cell wall biosynthesis